MCADIVIWARGLPAQQGRSELTKFCYESLFMKLFKTSNLGIVRYCQEQFCFELLSVILARRRTEFEAKFSNFLTNKYK